MHDDHMAQCACPSERLESTKCQCFRSVTDLEFQLLGSVLPVDCEREEPDCLSLLLEVQVGGQCRENSVDTGIMVAHNMHGSTLVRHSRLRLSLSCIGIDDSRYRYGAGDPLVWR